MLPLTVRDTVTVLRQRYPDALVCVECGRLISTQRKFYALTDEERLACVCAECHFDAREKAQQSVEMRASLARSKELARARRLRPPLVVSAESETHNAESHAFMERCAEAEVGGRMPCEHCRGSYLARACGYAAQDATAALQARNSRTRPSIRISPQTHFGPRRT